MLGVYTLTVFLAASLVFLIQPLIAKQLLPLLGGSPAVWNACMVFFQASLLAGYGYSHLIQRLRDPRRAAVAHLVFLLLPLPFLPLLVGDVKPVEGLWEPLWVCSVLAVTVAVPFVAVATTSPLLQRWFSRTDHAHASDPYFLYAASNAGSLLGLLIYPFVLEPALPVGGQAQVWSVAYGVFLVGVAACAALLFKRLSAAERQAVLGGGEGAGEAEAPAAGASAEVALDPRPPLEPISARRRLHWVILAMVPSSLVLGVTHHLSTDLAAIPLLWVVPLALYLLTFVIAFSKVGPQATQVATQALPLTLLLLVMAFLVEAADPLGALIALHTGGLLLCALACHGWLSAQRPPPEHLTEFFLWVALGGVLGGVFNGLVGPLVFPGLWEYPLMLVAVAALRPDPLAADAPEEGAGAAKGGDDASSERPPEGIHVPPIAFWLFPFLLALIWIVASALVKSQGWERNSAARLFQSMVPIVGCYLLSRRRWPFALGIALLLTLPILFPRGSRIFGEHVESRRTFFGIHSVWEGKDGRRVLAHGNTQHGLQRRDSEVPGIEFAPLAYYSRLGPVGDVFALLQGDPRLEEVGVIGLGIGSIAAYGEPGMNLTFYEIDPAVADLARKHFTFLKDSKATAKVVFGDGRLQLAEEADGRYGLLILDAFSSDAIPAHLITREAVELYLRKLRPGGLLLFHVSNRYLNLYPVLGNLARDLQITARGRVHSLSPQDEETGVLSSTWVLFAREYKDLGAILRHREWKVVPPEPKQRTWTDDYSNVLDVLLWH